MKKRITIILALLLSLAILVSCSPKVSTDTETPVAEDQTEQAEQLRIGVCLFTKNDEWLSTIADQFTVQSEAKGYHVNIQDGNMENEKQVQQIENFIAQEYDAIVLSAFDVDGILPAIDKCQEAGIPVIAIDTAIDHPWVSTVIAWDNAVSGQMLGEYAVKYIEEELADKETVNVVMLSGTGFPHLEKRDVGFEEALESLPQVEIIADQMTGGNREQSANVINNNIAKGIDIVYGVVDNHAWGAVTGLQEAQVEKCAVFSCGGYGDEPFTALEENHPYYKAIIVVPPTNIVTSAIEAVEKITAGESVEAVTNIEIGLADHSNVGDFR